MSKHIEAADAELRAKSHDYMRRVREREETSPPTGSPLELLDRLEFLRRETSGTILIQPPLTRIYGDNEGDENTVRFNAELLGIGRRLTLAASQSGADPEPFNKLVYGGSKFVRSDSLGLACSLLRTTLISGAQTADSISDIPHEHRTLTVSKADAAKLYNNGIAVRNPTDFFDKLIGKGLLTKPLGSGHKWQFDIRQFPDSAQDKLR